MIDGIIGAVTALKQRIEDQDKAINTLKSKLEVINASDMAMINRLNHQDEYHTLINSRVDALDRIVKILESRTNQNIKYGAPAQPVYTPPPMWTSPNTVPYTWPKNPFDVTYQDKTPVGVAPNVSLDKASY